MPMTQEWACSPPPAWVCSRAADGTLSCRVAKLDPALLFDFDFSRGDDRGVLFDADGGEFDASGAPTLMAEGAAGGGLRRDVADELDKVRVFGRGLGESAFYAI